MRFTNELTAILSTHLSWHKSRLDCFTQMITALLIVKTVNLKQIALAMPGKASPDSSYRRLQRFFKQFNLNTDQVAILIYRLFTSKQHNHYLILDRTNWKWGKQDINILVLAISCGNIAVPLLWTRVKTAGNSSMCTRKKLMRRYVKLFGSAHVGGLLADREFIGEKWFGFLINHRIPLYIRLKHNFLITNRFGRPAHIGKLLRNLKPGECRVFDKKRQLWHHAVWISATRNQSGELMIIASTQQPNQALQIYAIRWGIENLFQCLKGRGFEFEHTHMVDPKRIEKMMAVLAVAFSLALMSGQWRQDHIKPIKIKKHGRPAMSLFRYGLDFLRQTLLRQQFSTDFRALFKSIIQRCSTLPSVPV